MKLVREKSFYKTLLMITIPVALQNLISTGVSMMDTIMLGQMGDLQISASSLANQPFFVFSLVSMGLACGASVLTAQYWGRGDIKAIRHVIAIVLRFAFVIGTAVTAVVYFFPAQIMSIFTNEADVIAEGVKYLQIVAFSYFFYGMTNTFLQVMRSVEKVVMSLAIYGSSFFINVFFNYIFIFGKFGAPEMGIAGAAVGTLIARFCEFLMAIIYIAFIEKKVRFSFRDLFKFDKLLTADFVRHSTPVVLNEVLWGVGASITTVVLGHLGKTAVTANSICSVVQQLSLVVVFGISSSASVLIGKTIGSGQEHKVRQYAYTLQLLSVAFGVISAAIVFSIRGSVISIYKIAPETAALANNLMIAYAIIVFFQCAIIPTIMGTLRGGGDGKFVMWADLLSMYGIAVPLGILAAFVWGWPVVAVVFLLKVDEPVKMVITFFRLRGNKWIKNLTRSKEEIEEAEVQIG